MDVELLKTSIIVVFATLLVLAITANHFIAKVGKAKEKVIDEQKLLIDGLEGANKLNKSIIDTLMNDLTKLNDKFVLQKRLLDDILIQEANISSIFITKYPDLFRKFACNNFDAIKEVLNNPRVISLFNECVEPVVNVNVSEEKAVDSDTLAQSERIKAFSTPTLETRVFPCADDECIGEYRQ